jgi:sodium/hydrogen exchanger-like protein 6/7
MGAIFAATDSVATLTVLDRRTMPNLFSLVFGEGVINDAVSVVLLGALHTITTTAAAAKSHGSSSSAGGVAGGLVVTFIYLLVTSFCLGAGAGLGIALVLKKMHLSGSHQVK